MNQMVILDEINPSVTSVIEAIDIVSAGNQMLRDFLDLVRKAGIKHQLVYYNQDTSSDGEPPSIADQYRTRRPIRLSSFTRRKAQRPP